MRHTDTQHHIDGIGLHMDRLPVETHQSRKAGCGPVTLLEDSTRLVLDGLHTFMIGSVVSYALRNGDDPVEAIDHARSLGHELVYIFANGAVISSGGSLGQHRAHVRVTLGMRVQFEGNIYTIEKAPNHNLRLQPVPAAVAA